MNDQTLESIPLFASLSKRERRQVAMLVDEIDLPAGQSLIREGSFSYEFFAIVNGVVEVRQHGEVVAERGPGEFVGETGILSRRRRNADVVAKTPVRALVMTSQALQSVDRLLPGVSQQIRDTIADRSLAPA